MTKYIKMDGKKFGRWVVIRYHSRTKLGDIRWLCKCQCGTKRAVLGGSLRKGLSKSCGCMIAESTKKRFTKHGLYKEKVYKLLGCIFQRCTNKKHTAYDRYGGRGIKICKEWHKNPMNFISWAKANGYKEGLTIDRIDNNGDYEPSNCRFVTHKENCSNTNNCFFWHIKGEVFNTQKKAAKFYGVSVGTIRNWCLGVWGNNKFYPAKDDCWRIKQYQPKE